MGWQAALVRTEHLLRGGYDSLPPSPIALPPSPVCLREQERLEYVERQRIRRERKRLERESLELERQSAASVVPALISERRALRITRGEENPDDKFWRM